MAPEQVEGLETDTRADIFSFGCVLYEMLSGKRAFDGKSASSVMAAILEREPVPLATAGAQLDWVIRRCLEKDRYARFQSVHDIRLELDRPAAAQAHRARPWRERAAWAIAGLSLVALSVLWWKLRIPSPAPVAEFTQLTYDAGVTSRPDISPDGKFVVYASDRDNQKNLDLYLQQIPNGNPMRLTNTSEDENEPAFSPDGASIVFSSTRNGGGIYIMPAIGGEPRLLARGGHWPKFSPDGSSVAYCTSALTTGDLFGLGTQTFVVPAGGGVPRPIAPEFDVVREPLWSPDGSRILFLGEAPGEGPVLNRRGYWVVPAEGGKPERSDFAMGDGLIDSWKRDGFYIVNHRVSDTHDARNIYRLPVDAEGRRAGAPIQLTAGASRDAWPATSHEGRMVFASGSEHVNLWAVPLDASEGKVTGAPYRISSSLAWQSVPRLSPDGRKLLFGSTRSGVLQMWQTDLTTGRETLIVPKAGSSPVGGYMPASGRIAYRIRNTRGDFDTYILDPATGESRKMLSNGYIWSINRAETLALARTPAGILAGIDGLDLKSGRRFPLLRGQHDQWNLYDAYFSPDERWILFLTSGADKTRIFVARVKGTTAAPREEWLPVTDEALAVEKPRFSPDGGLIYFTLDRENSRGIYAVRFDAESGKPRGEPFLVYDFPGPRKSMFQLDVGQLNISVAQDKLVTVLSEANWNIWMTDLRGKQ
jgi:Tol biopolymer transport system component